MSTEVKVSKLPPCDVHIAYRKPGAGTRLAMYDGATKEGPWAYMCDECFKEHGVGLGTGQGQRLILEEGEMMIPEDRSLAEDCRK